VTTPETVPVTTSETTSETIPATIPIWTRENTPETTPGTTSETTPFFTGVPEPVCPSGYSVKVGRSCYKVIPEGVEWSNGLARCRQDDQRGHLAYIETAEQNDKLVDYMLTFKGTSQCFVTGAPKEIFYTSGEREHLDDCTKKEFIWSVNETTTIQLSTEYQNWKTGEPNCYEGRKENCLSYKCEDVGGIHTCYWIDYECTRPGCLLCQIDL